MPPRWRPRDAHPGWCGYRGCRNTAWPVRFPAQHRMRDIRQRMCEIVGDLCGTFALKRNCVAQVEDVPVEDALVRVIFHLGSVSLIGQQTHGCTPASRRKFRISRISNRLAFRSGCGSWKTATMPFSEMAIRDPARCLTVAPSDWSSDTISSHGICVGGGIVKSNSSVLRCFVFTRAMIAKGASRIKP